LTAPGHVTSGGLIFWADVEYGYQPILESLTQLRARDGLQRIAKIAAQELADVRQVALCDAVQCRHQIEHGWIAQAVQYVFAVATRSQQPRLAHQLEMLRGVGDRQSCTSRKRFDAPFALSRPETPLRVPQNRYKI
jgi:hypothetical protein